MEEIQRSINAERNCYSCLPFSPTITVLSLPFDLSWFDIQMNRWPFLTPKWKCKEKLEAIVFYNKTFLQTLRANGEALFEVTEAGGVQRRSNSVRCCQSSLLSGPLQWVSEAEHQQRGDNPRTCNLFPTVTLGLLSPLEKSFTSYWSTCFLHHLHSGHGAVDYSAMRVLTKCIRT